MTWFTDLTGIATETPDAVRALLRLQDGELVSEVNGRRFAVGDLTTPALSELRKVKVPAQGPVTVEEYIADVQTLHRLPENAGATFQVASQFNLLEMIGPSVAPEHGIGRYEDDKTQGPACAIACGAGTIFRNYFVPVRGQVGQSGDRQIDCLEDIGAALKNHRGALWNMQNGYVLPTKQGLSTIRSLLTNASEAEKDRLRGLLRVGVHSDTEVTFHYAGHRVTQVYCSALPVAYGAEPPENWAAFAKLILDAAYEATVLAAVSNAAKTGNNRLFLTLLGGGAFGNNAEWIRDAVIRAIGLIQDSGLDIRLVSYGASNTVARSIVSRFC